jgi:hypothetical protein
MKPVCVQNYNENMGAIDLVHIQLNCTECIRRTIKWYKNFFFHVVDMASMKAFYLHKTQNSNNLQLKEFRLQLYQNMVIKNEFSLEDHQLIHDYVYLIDIFHHL